MAVARSTDPLSMEMVAGPTASVWMRGAPGENVTVAWLPPLESPRAAHAELHAVATSVVHRTCKVGASGQAVMRVSRNAIGNRRPEEEWHVVCE